MTAALRFPEMMRIRPTTPRAAEFVTFAKKHGFQFVTGSACKSWVPQVGDIVVYRFPRGHHVGIVDAPLVNGSFYAIEGNTDAEGSREGDGVWHKQRNFQYVAAFIRLI